MPTTWTMYNSFYRLDHICRMHDACQTAWNGVFFETLPPMQWLTNNECHLPSGRLKQKLAADFFRWCHKGSSQRQILATLTFPLDEKFATSCDASSSLVYWTHRAMTVELLRDGGWMCPGCVRIVEYFPAHLRVPLSAKIANSPTAPATVAE